MSIPRLPIVPVVRPADLAGQTNGQLAEHLLTPVSPRKDWSMHRTAARAWEGLRAAGWAAGVPLSVSGNPYRSYDAQVQLFQSRYKPNQPSSIDKKGRLWNGVRWFRHSGAPAAVPGTSNHGWGLAVDTAIDSDGDLDFEWPPKSLNIPAIHWLLDNVARFGFSWEMQSEPWHLRYIAGDRIPQAVLDFEASGVAPAPAPTLVQASVVAPAADDVLAQVARAIDQARTHVLRHGSGGANAPKEVQDAVWWCQNFLTAKGYATTRDGWFGPKTAAKVRAFQRAKGLVVDGVVAKQTWAALLK